MVESFCNNYVKVIQPSFPARPGLTFSVRTAFVTASGILSQVVVTVVSEVIVSGKNLVPAAEHISSLSGISRSLNYRARIHSLNRSVDVHSVSDYWSCCGHSRGLTGISCGQTRTNRRLTTHQNNRRGRHDHHNLLYLVSPCQPVLVDIAIIPHVI